ncbi:MAG: hypothetical protein HY718_16435 [Planctomycetes bacterium]|nr:hypothetical protein [Planctomycetota bacterium]
MLAMVLAAGAAWGASTRPAEVFEPKQHDRLPAEWRAAGGQWSIRDGRLTGSAAATVDSTLILGDGTWRDVAVEVEVAFAPGEQAAGWLGIVVRDGGESAPGVQFVVRPDTKRSNGFEISTRRPAPGQGWRVLQINNGESALATGKTHRLRIEALGDWISGQLDGKLVVRSCRGDEFPRPGRVGLRVSGTSVMIDRVSIQSIEPVPDAASTRVRTRPLVIAHRGFSWVAPENTLASFRLAMETGAEMAECDVYLTKDRVPILLHDATLTRTTGRKAKPGDLTLAEIKQLDAGKWKAPEYTGERIPTLTEALGLVKGRMRMVIELKQESIGAEVLESIRASGTDPQDLMVFSFHANAVDQIGRLEPLLPTTWLVDKPGLDTPVWRKTLAEALRVRASAVGTSLPHVDPGFVRLAHECGLSVFVWTVDEPEDMSYLIRLGVDGIITDRPDVLLALLESRDQD